MSIHEPSSKNKSDTPSSALFGVALLQGLIGFAGWNMFGWDALPWSQRIFMLSAVFYLVLAVVAKKAPLPASLIGIGLFMVYLGLQAANGIPWRTAGLIYKAPVAILLIVALSKSLGHRPGSQAVRS